MCVCVHVCTSIHNLYDLCRKGCVYWYTRLAHSSATGTINRQGLIICIQDTGHHTCTHVQSVLFSTTFRVVFMYSLRLYDYYCDIQVRDCNISINICLHLYQFRSILLTFSLSIPYILTVSYYMFPLCKHFVLPNMCTAT
jgi:hypothetical protein